MLEYNVVMNKRARLPETSHFSEESPKLYFKNKTKKKINNPMLSGVNAMRESNEGDGVENDWRPTSDGTADHGRPKKFYPQAN